MENPILDGPSVPDPAPELTPEQVAVPEATQSKLRSRELTARSGQELLRSLRQTIGASQRELSLKTGFARSHLAHIERGQEPRVSVLQRIMERLGGHLELAARFSCPMADIAEEFGRRRIAEDYLRHERRVARNLERRRLGLGRNGLPRAKSV